MTGIFLPLAQAIAIASGSSSAIVDADAEAATADPVKEIVVTGERPGYGVRATSTATKTNTDIKDIPQALTVVTRAQIDDQQLRSVGELLLFVPGASYNSGEGNRDTLVLRGNSSTADFFLDGVRDDVQYFRDFYNIERLEVLRGPNAMIFGRGGGGGIINRVTKRATFRDGRSFTASGDSEGGFRLTGDVDQALAPGAGLRVNGLYEDGRSFRDHVRLKRYGINPTAGTLIGPHTRVDVGYEYFHDGRTADRGVPSVTDPAGTDEPIRGFDKIFFGDPSASFAKVKANVGTLAVEHEFSDNLRLRNRTQLGSYRKFYQNVFASNLDEATDEVMLNGYNNRTNRRNLFSQTDLVWDNRIGSVEQTLLFGFELGRQRSRNMRMTAILPDNRVPLADPTVDSGATFAPDADDSNNRARASIAAVYVQDQVRFTPWLELVAGIRFDRFRLKVDDFRGAGAQFQRTDNLVSPRVGLIVKPVPRLSLYASYGRSYLPQSGDQFSSLTVDTETLKPERFDNYELGAKWEVVPGLLATAAIYHLDRTNTRAVDTLDPTHIVLTGAQRSRGLELGLERSLTDRWQVSAGYAYQDAKITETTTAAPAGRKVPLVPRHSFSLWNRYDVTNKVGLGLGVIARSKSFTSISNAVQLPGYTRVDAAAFYKVAPGIDAQLNVENLFGEHYFPTANSDNNIAPGAPRTVRATLRFGF